MLAILLVATICGVAFVLLENQHAVEIAEGERNGNNLALVVAEQTARALQPIDLTLREIQGRLSGIGSGQNEIQAKIYSREIFDLLIELSKSLPQAANMMVVDADGHLANHTFAYPIVPVDVSSRDYFQYLSTHDDHELFVSVPALSYTTKQWVVFMGRRINDQSGAFAGIVVANITLSYLGDFYRAVTSERNGVTLLRRDGVVLAHYPIARGPVLGNKLPSNSPWYQAVAAGSGFYRSAGPPFDDVPRLVSVHPVGDFPLVVDTTVPEAVILGQWRQQASWVVAAAIVASAVVILLIWAFARQYQLLLRQNDQVETSRRKFDLVLNSMSQGLTFFDAKQRLIVCNHRYAEIYNLSPEFVRPGTLLADIIEHRMTTASAPDMTVEDYLTRRNVAADAGTSFDIADEFRDGRTVLQHFEPFSDGGWVATHEDITERRRAETGMAFMAHHDPLTQLPNRILFQEQLTQGLAAASLDSRCALLCLDLDRFKVINDTLGHPVGDSLLRIVAERLQAILRDADTVARLGGDEFAIILTGLKSADIVASLADRILNALREPYEVDGQRVITSVSIGIALAPTDAASPEALMKKADIALYMAKTQGRGTYRFFKPGIDSHVEQRRAVEMELRNAVPSEDFELHYQPIVSLISGQVTAFEALIRWNHPVRGMVSPAEFIPIAEETGLIVAIGEWALGAACREAASWPSNIEISVNLSPVQFNDARLPDIVRQAVAAAGLAPERLKLEITESVLMENNEDTVALLHQFRACGIQIALDDFGTGFSSLSYLRRFPFDKIKIDRTFIRDIDTNHASAVIVGAIVAIGQGLGMRIIVEGVETLEQLAKVRAQGCDSVQGYLFSRPRPAAEVLTLIQSLGMMAPRMLVDNALIDTTMTGSLATQPIKAVEHQAGD